MNTLDTLLRTVEAIGPIALRAVSSGQLVHPACHMTKADPDVLAEYGVEIPVAGGMTLTANIFRSRRAAQSGEAWPVVMCAHPYDNRKTASQHGTPLNGPPQQYRIIPQERPPSFSELTSWESPDPNFWVGAGYAVVNLNLPGYASSGGQPSVFGRDQAEGYHDAIEWVAQQPWCTGAIGLNGVSFLAISQYYVAAGVRGGRPPSALKAICPWEGLSDPYHDLFAAGGLRELGFPAFWWSTEVKDTINGSVQDFLEVEGCLPTEFAVSHPTYDHFWKAKRSELSKIEVPMLVCASFSDHNLHTQGSFRAFVEASSPYKWVYTHRGGKWSYYYDPAVQELTRRFMDCFVKDEDNGFHETARVRLEVRSSRDEIYEVRGESEWPIARTEYRPLYLSADQTLIGEASQTADELVFDARTGSLSFSHCFEAPTELTGHITAHLGLSVEGEGRVGAPVDLGLVLYVRKRGQDGRVVPFYGSVGSDNDVVSRGYFRAALRTLDPERSTEAVPVLAANRLEEIVPGERFEAVVALYPTSLRFEAGDVIELVVAGHEVVASNPYRKDLSMNRGRCIIHLGALNPSYL
ncbi:MAG: CocE/NonD family hydrolase, partial [Myxococcota bacterium]